MSRRKNSDPTWDCDSEFDSDDEYLPRNDEEEGEFNFSQMQKKSKNEEISDDDVQFISQTQTHDIDYEISDDEIVNEDVQGMIERTYLFFFNYKILLISYTEKRIKFIL